MRVDRETLKKIGLSPSKYGNKRTRCLSKHLHDSKAEATYCNSLLADLQAGRIKEYHIQSKFGLAPGISHIVDFLVFKPDQTIEVHEVKGFPTKEWMIKYKMFCLIHPNIKYVIINRKEEKNGLTTEWLEAKLAERRSKI